jgi:hypothetical protein
MNDRHDNLEDRSPAPDETLRLPAPEAREAAPPTQWSEEDSGERETPDSRQAREPSEGEREMTGKPPAPAAQPGHGEGA